MYTTNFDILTPYQHVTSLLGFNYHFHFTRPSRASAASKMELFVILQFQTCLTYIVTISQTAPSQMFAVVLDMHLHLTFFIWIEELINYFSNILKQRLGPFLYIHARQFSINLRFDGNNLLIGWHHYLELSIFKSLELRRQVRSPQDIKCFLCDEPENSVFTHFTLTNV